MNSSVVTGFLFSILWASASVAGKFGLRYTEPLVLFNLRFLGAGILLLLYVTVISKERLPDRNEWKNLTLFGALNTTLYLGLFVLALQTTTPGITTLAVAINPVLISVMTSLWSRRKVKGKEWLSVMLGFCGILIAAWPLLHTQYASLQGLLLLFFSQLCYSAGAVYYGEVNWKLSRIAINGWQVFLGGILLLPFTLLLHERAAQPSIELVFSLLWLIVPVSIIAVQLWLVLLKRDAIRASLWLFLCPLFGFTYAHLFFNEPISLYTLAGTSLVLVALYLGQLKRH